MKKTVEAYLINKPFESIKDDYVPVPIRKGKYGVNEIIARIKPQLPFVDQATMASIIEAFNQKAVELVSDGYNIDTGLVYLRPMITGTADVFQLDKKINKLTIAALPGKALRSAAAQTKISLTERQNRPKGIWFVSNAQQVNEPLIEKGLVRVGGVHVKIMGDFSECGLWFYNEITKQSYQIDQPQIYNNNPKTLLFTLPDIIPAGNYSLKLITCYCGTSRLLVTPKEYVFHESIEILPVR